MVIRILKIILWIPACVIDFVIFLPPTLIKFIITGESMEPPCTSWLFKL